MPFQVPPQLWAGCCQSQEPRSPTWEGAAESARCAPQQEPEKWRCQDADHVPMGTINLLCQSRSWNCFIKVIDGDDGEKDGKSRVLCPLVHPHRELPAAGSCPRVPDSQAGPGPSWALILLSHTVAAIHTLGSTWAGGGTGAGTGVERS